MLGRFGFYSNYVCFIFPSIYKYIYIICFYNIVINLETDMNDKIFEIVIATINDFNEESDNKIDISNGRESELFGGNSEVDSLELVNLIVEIEENISEKFNKNITITSEKAMSRNTSPFINIGTITDYIEEILNE